MRKTASVLFTLALLHQRARRVAAGFVYIGLSVSVCPTPYGVLFNYWSLYAGKFDG